MRIKTDFVTNSSSTCFIVFVPNNYVPSDEALIKAMEEQLGWWDDEEDNPPETAEEYLPILKQEILECIEDLKQGKDIYKDNYGDGVDYKVYSTVDCLMSREGFGLTSIDTAGDGLDQIVGVPEDKIIKILGENLDLKSFCKVAGE